MENSPENMSSSDIRLVLIGGRWSGKSSSANTILRKERFDCGQVRTAQAEVRHEVVEGRKLIVVDAPGWGSHLRLTEIPEGDKQRFKLNASKCPPGPSVFLLVVPVDSSFSAEQRTAMELHMKLLGERVWRFTMVLFTCGDYLVKKTIEQHIESEGAALMWLIEKCGNRYHVFNNKDKSDSSQVSELLQKIDQMVANNDGRYYKVDEQTLTIITKKQQEVAERAKERQRKAEEQRRAAMTLITEDMNPFPELRIILLGSRSVGKTSVGNTIFGFKDQEEGKRTAHSVVRQGFVDQTKVTLVDTPGWWKGFPALDTPEAIKEAMMSGLFLCPPGPHLFLLVIDADASFNVKHLDAVTTHVELLGDDLWEHVMIVFTRGDWLGTHTIEEYIEGEGEALRSLVERCGNRYHVLNNKNWKDGAQVAELLEKISGTVARNGGKCFVPDEQLLSAIEEKQRRVQQGALLRQSQVQEMRRSLRGSRNTLREIRVAMLGQKTSGKSAAGNTILRKKAFSCVQDEICKVEEGKIAGRKVTVIDTPGWRESSRCSVEIDKEIAEGLTMNPPGVHTVLLVIPLDLTFREVHRVALEEHMNLFDPIIWKHTIVLFTHGDRLADRSIEENIEQEGPPLRWLVDKCENKYHVVNNLQKSNASQVSELFEKIEEMVAENGNRLFCPDIHSVHLKISEKLNRRQLKDVLKKRLEREYRRRELELMTGLRDTLIQVQEEIRQSGATVGDTTKSLVESSGFKKKNRKEKNVDMKISQEIEELERKIMRSNSFLRSSMEAVFPNLKGDSPAPSIAESRTDQMRSTSHFNKVLDWLSDLQITTGVDNQFTLNFSQATSGYKSEFPPDCGQESVQENMSSSDIRLVLIGGRWSGKSLSANTILRKERFDFGRVRTVQAEVRHEVVEGRKLIVVDAPGWGSPLSLTEIPEGDKQRFKLNASKCPPGPSVFLLVIPVDSAFSAEQRTAVELHMKLLGERVWRFTMVLFTCGDYLVKKTIEQHIESEGAALMWLIEKCGNRYHVFNNKDKSDSSQVSELLQKIDQMVANNDGRYYKVDEQTLTIITKKQQEVAERAKERQRKAEEQRRAAMTLITEDMNPFPELRLILLGCRSVGKTSVGNTIFGFKDQEEGKRTAHSVVRQGFVDQTKVTLVDTPGWWKGFPALDTPEAIKEEMMSGLFLCPPGPHLFLLVIDADASFNVKHLDAVTTHVELLGDDLWEHVMIVFTRGDWLGTHTIEEYIEGEGEALRSLVERCGNRYHVLNNKNWKDGAQVAELLEKISGTVARNGGKCFVPDEQLLSAIEEKQRRVQQGALLRQSQVQEMRRSLRGRRNILQEIRVAMLGQKTSGKSAAGNTILRKKAFSCVQDEICKVEEGKIADRKVTVIDTPGWRESSRCSVEIDKEIAEGLTMNPPGVHTVLLVIPLDLTFREVHRVALEEHMNLFDPIIWKHTIVLFTHGDRLADRSIEEHIEQEGLPLRWLVDKCENKYHVVNNLQKSDASQVSELFKKIEEMAAANGNRLFCPDIHSVHLKISEKLNRKQLKDVLKKKLEKEYRRRELELMTGFRDTLVQLQEEIRQSGATVGDTTKSLVKSSGFKKKNRKDKTVDTKISQEIEEMEKKIKTCNTFLQGSMEALFPDLKGDSPAPSIAESRTDQMRSTRHFNKVLDWLSHLQINTGVDNQFTLNFSEVTSGYKSAFPPDFGQESVQGE
ncbi:uncharacterized protein ACNS7B_003928 [Menidia menidia]